MGIRPRRRIAGLALAVCVPAVLTLPMSSSEADEKPTACPKNEVPVAGFADTVGSVHAGAIDCLAWWKITEGSAVDAGGMRQFSPGASTTRAQMATFLHRLLAQTDASLATAKDNPFSDVSPTSVHHDAIVALAHAKVINGVSASSFAPSRDVTRAQVASLIDRTHREVFGKSLAEGSTTFPDVPEDSVHAAAISRLAAAGIARGLDDGRFGPASPVTRAQMASFLTRYASMLVGDGLAQPPSEDAALDAPRRISFGGVTLGARVEASLTLTNSGRSTIEVEGTQITGSRDYSDDFGPEPVELAPGEWTSISVRFRPSAEGDRIAELVISHSATKSPHVVALHGTGGGSTMPDGAPVLAFSSAPAGCGSHCAEQSSVWVTDPGAGTRMQVTDPIDAADRFPRWSPGGEELAFTRVDRASGRGEVHLMRADGDRLTPPQPLTDTRNAHNDAGCDGESMIPEWSPEGSRLAVTCAAAYGFSEIIVAPIDGGSQFSLDGGGHHHADSNPTWSPDGAQLAFERLNTHVPYGREGRVSIWTQRIGSETTSKAEVLVSGERAAGQPAWSPVAQRVLYVEIDEHTFETSLKSVVPSTGARDTHFTAEAAAPLSLYSTSWAPDGTAVAFSRGDALTSSVVEVLELDDGSVRGLSSAGAMAFAPTWMPDASAIVFDQFGYEDGVGHQRLLYASRVGDAQAFVTQHDGHPLDAHPRPRP